MHDLKFYSSYNPTQLKKNSSDVFNDVQKDGLAMIESKTRPDMIIITLHEYEKMVDFYQCKINQLTGAVKMLDSKGDAKNQLDLLKG